LWDPTKPGGSFVLLRPNPLLTLVSSFLSVWDVSE
jgi:hypothetical protein